MFFVRNNRQSYFHFAIPVIIIGHCLIGL